MCNYFPKIDTFFSGHCLLFTTGKWREEDGMFDPRWSSSGFCDFPLVTGIFMLIISCVQIYRYARMKDEEGFLALFIDVVLSIWMLAMSIISSIMITLGFIVWCDGMTERFPTCEITAGQNIIHGNTDNIDTSGFYIEMGTAQVGFLLQLMLFSCFQNYLIFSFKSLVLGVHLPLMLALVL